MSQINWNYEATKMAARVGEKMSEAHRGAMPWHEEGVSVVFGNDGYDSSLNEYEPEEDSRAQREVNLVRGVLERQGIEVLGFGVDPLDAYSWAMLVRSGDIQELNSIVWQAWHCVNGTHETIEPGLVPAGVQSSIAASAIAKNAD